MMTSSYQTFSALLALCAGNSAGTVEFPSKVSVTQSFDIFFHLRLNKRLSKQSQGWWFETPSYPLWRHCNDEVGVVSYPVRQNLRGTFYPPSWEILPNQVFFIMEPTVKSLI